MKFDESAILQQLSNPATRRRAFAGIVNHYSSALYWQIRHIVTYHEDADDVLQNTFVKVWNSIDSFRGTCKLSTWLYRIAYNESITWLNRSQMHAMTSLDSDTEEKDGNEVPSADRLQGDDYFDGDRAQMLLQEAIELLPVKQKAVFVMKYYDDMKYEDMSEVTGTSVGALKASYHFAVKKIADYIHEHEL